VLAFYQERIANEAFIRTATLRDSVLRLVRVIDYQLAPGAAPTTVLAFTLERDATALIPARTRVQSVPAEGETPQKYETLEDLAASGHLNRLRLFPTPEDSTLINSLLMPFRKQRDYWRTPDGEVLRRGTNIGSANPMRMEE
jgi:hypothetical protein